MACEFVCDWCGKRVLGVPSPDSGWLKPHEWYQRRDEDGIQDACSRGCIDVIASRTGKTGVVLPV